MVDVLVIGGGPAGSVTALLLARAGWSVTLLERQRFPRAKPCGDCLSPGANRVLVRLGLWDAVLACRPAQLSGWRLISPAGHSFSAEFAAVTNDTGAHTSLAIARDRFDAALLEQARLAGVAVQHGVRVVDLLRAADGAITGVRARQGDELLDYHARLTVGADGLRSVIARKLGAHARAPRLRKTSFTAHIPMLTNGDFGELRVLPNGCIGIAPVEAGNEPRLHNVTIVLNRGSYQRHGGARSIMNRTMNALGWPDLPERVTILASGPFDWPVRQTVFPGAVLVGDAAGYYDPFTGQGIYHALTGAELLAAEAARALSDRRLELRNLSRYSRALRARQRSAQRVQHVIEIICARPRLADRTFAFLSHHKMLADKLVGVTGDLLPPHSLLSMHAPTRLAG